MRLIKFNMSTKRFYAMLLALVCMLLFSFFSELGNDSITHGTPALDINQGTASNHGDNLNALLPRENKSPMVDVLYQSTESFQITQNLLNIRRPSSRKNYNYMTTFYGLPYGFSFLFLLLFISQCTIFKFNRHLTVPHSIHAPPYFFC